MKRKLCSILMGAFAILLLVGAGAQRDYDATVLKVAAAELIQNEMTTDDRTETQEAIVAVPGVSIEDVEPLPEIEEPSLVEDDSLLLNGEPVGVDTKKSIVGGVSYVALRAMAEDLDETAEVSWDASTETVTITTAQLNLTATEGEDYLIANGRYLYLPLGLQVVEGVTMVPLTVLAKAFDATVSWDDTTGTISVHSGSGGIQSGDTYYDSDELFWLSRVIYAESGHEPMIGRIGVGNVVLNRVSNPIYPNTIFSVIAQKNQFSTYKNGRLADRTPNQASVIAAKLVLDGAVTAGLENATHFDTGGSTWASKNKTCVAVIGGHKFYA